MEKSALPKAILHSLLFLPIQLKKSSGLVAELNLTQFSCPKRATLVLKQLYF